MSLRKRTIITIGLCFGALILILFTTTKTVIDKRNKLLEEKQIVKNLNRSINALTSMSEDLDLYVKDWAFWDDSHKFLTNYHDEYVTSNLTIETFLTSRISMVIYLTPEKEIYWAKMLDHKQKSLIPVNPSTGEKIARSINKSSSPLKDQGFSGLQSLEGSLYLTSGRPVLKSNQTGPSAGWIIMARAFDNKTIAELEKRTELNLSFFQIGELSLPTELKEMANQDGTISSEHMIRRSENEIYCSKAITGQDKRQMAIVTVSSPRDIYKTGVKSSRLLLGTIIITGLFICGLALFFLEKLMLTRVLTLTRQVKSLEDPSPDIFIGLGGDDELSRLSTSIRQMTQKIRENEKFLMHVLASIPSGVVIIDPKTSQVREISTFALELVGKSRDEIINKPCRNFPVFPDSISNQKPFQSELTKEDGKKVPIIISCTEIVLENTPMILQTFLDFTDINTIQQELRRSEEKYKTLFMNTGNASILVGEDTRIILANQEFRNLSNIPEKEQVKNIPWTDFFFPEDADRMKEYLTVNLGFHRSVPKSFEARFKSKNDEIRTVTVILAVIPGTTRSLLSIIDITVQKKVEMELEKKAFYDPLTGLPNRQLFKNRLLHAIEASQRSKKEVGVFLLDIDEFKHVNDTLGHDAGDQLLKEITKRIKKSTRKTDTLARFGGDEFTLLVENHENLDVLCRIAEDIIKQFTTPFSIRNTTFHLGVSIGIVLYPHGGEDPENLIKNADLAMYKSKKEGKNRYNLFTESMNEKAQRRLVVEKYVRKSLEEDRFTVFYQPKIKNDSGEIHGMEALVRGTRDDGTIVSPWEFIPFAESSGLIIPLDFMVLRKACTQTAEWISRGHENLVVSVNLSTRHFQNEGLTREVENILKETGLKPSALELEVTETAMMENLDLAMKSLSELGEMGISLSLDDFGTGYSSLYYLQNLPFQTLKIDKSFIDNLGASDNNSEELVKTIITLAENMHLTAVAEGVETREQWEWLRSSGCPQSQGYLFSKPLSASSFEDFLVSHKPGSMPG